MKALLEWYVAAGVDEATALEPQDQFARAERAARERDARKESQEAAHLQAAATASPVHATRSAPPPGAPAGRPPLVRPEDPVPVSDREAMASAAELAAGCMSVAELHAALEVFDGCALKKNANLCFTDGNPEADILFIGEGPGAEEDRRGKPFVGPSGQLLDAMLASIGLDRTAVLISNTVFWRPPGNRTPTPQETAVCYPFVERLIEVTAPRLIVAVGGPAAKALFHQTQGITKLRGKWFQVTAPKLADPVRATALYHPAYLLRSPAMKRDAWRDLLMIEDALKAD